MEKVDAAEGEVSARESFVSSYLKGNGMIDLRIIIFFLLSSTERPCRQSC